MILLDNTFFDPRFNLKRRNPVISEFEKKCIGTQIDCAALSVVGSNLT